MLIHFTEFEWLSQLEIRAPAQRLFCMYIMYTLWDFEHSQVHPSWKYYDVFKRDLILSRRICLIEPSDAGQEGRRCDFAIAYIDNLLLPPFCIARIRRVPLNTNIIISGSKRETAVEWKADWSSDRRMTLHHQRGRGILESDANDIFPSLSLSLSFLCLLFINNVSIDCFFFYFRRYSFLCRGECSKNLFLLFL